jgi:hypothetical protein
MLSSVILFEHQAHGMYEANSVLDAARHWGMPCHTTTMHDTINPFFKPNAFADISRSEN